MADTDYILRKIGNGWHFVNMKPVKIKHTIKLETMYQNSSQILKWWIIQQRVTSIMGIDFMDKLNNQVVHRKPQIINNVKTENFNIGELYTIFLNYQSKFFNQSTTLNNFKCNVTFEENFYPLQ